MSFPPVTEMFQFTGFASPTYVFSRRSPLRAGFPHSEIHGSTGARPSPWLIAACYVLHRLSVPRHPPDALIDAWSQQIMSRTEKSLRNRNHRSPRHIPRSGPTSPPPRQEDMARQRGPERLGHSLTPIHDVQHSRTSPPKAVLPEPISSLEEPSPASPGPALDRPRGRRRLVEADGIEPTTPCLQSRCSPS